MFISMNLDIPFLKKSVFPSKEFAMGAAGASNDLEFEVVLGGSSVIGLFTVEFNFLSILHSVMFGRMLNCVVGGGATVGTAATVVAVKNLLILNKNVR